MPLDLPKTIEECHQKIIDQHVEIETLKARSENSVGGFLSRNQGVIVALIMAVTAALGGSIVSLYQNQNTRTELQQTQEKQAANKEAIVHTSNRVDSLDSKIVPPVVFEPKGKSVLPQAPKE